MPRYKAEVILFFVATLWAATFPILKVTLAEFPPFYFVAFRFLIAAICFSVFFYKTISFKEKGIIAAGLLMSVLLLIGFSTQSIGLRFTSSSNSALITGINVLFVPFVQFFLTRKKVFIENWIGVLLVTIGLYFLTQPEINGLNIGDWITMLCSLSWAFYIIYLDIFTNKFKSINTLIFIQFWVTAALAFAIGFVFEDHSKVTFGMNNIYALLYTGLFATFVATTLGNKYQKFTTPIRATLVMAWETPAAVIISIFALAEGFRFIQYFGAALMIGGILFSESFDFFRKQYFTSRITADEETL